MALRISGLGADDDGALMQEGAAAYDPDAPIEPDWDELFPPPKPAKLEAWVPIGIGVVGIAGALTWWIVRHRRRMA